MKPVKFIIFLEATSLLILPISLFLITPALSYLTESLLIVIIGPIAFILTFVLSITATMIGVVSLIKNKGNRLLEYLVVVGILEIIFITWFLVYAMNYLHRNFT